ncbi:hypothetical protein JBE04_06745 [Streptomyces sp. PRKS01-29]|nr:hypothetical protein [Streptomyces sabulosicollis]MBI0294186.1 hypothetical protein [Streptomyces sabulosicollis]
MDTPEQDLGGRTGVVEKLLVARKIAYGTDVEALRDRIATARRALDELEAGLDATGQDGERLVAADEGMGTAAPGFQLERRGMN